MKHKPVNLLLFLAFLILCNACMSRTILQQNAARRLSALDFQSEQFRRQQLSDGILPCLLRLKEESSLSLGEIMTVSAARGATSKRTVISGRTPEYFSKWIQIFLKYNSAGYTRVSNAYAAIWNDIRCFPVADVPVSYENSWMFERTYGGLRGHEGTDLMPPENISGYYWIVSITDGVIEKIGWLPQGGYRIGIRSPSGGYFYYAHLANYSQEFYIGETIEAGTVLGTMGDTGYGPEGTTGQFPVHLHLGIYIATESQPELSVNPYWVLRYLETSLP